jgi:prophage regulatory protein
MVREPPPERMLNLHIVMQRTGLCKTTVYRRVKDGTFPPIVQLSKRRVGWRESEINRWMRSPSTYEPPKEAP